MSATFGRASSCTVIAALPYTISAPGIYCITRKFATNLAAGAAITINANNVVLDLNANTIGNLAAPAATTRAVGILADSRQNVTVQNGTVRGFGVGVALVDYAAPGTSSGNEVRGIVSDQSRLIGIAVTGTGAAVRGSRVAGTNGSAAPGPFDGAAQNGATGILVSGAGAQVIGNEVIDTGCTNGCYPGSSARGISVVSSPGAVVWRNSAVNGAMAAAASSVALHVDPASPNVFADGNYLSGYINGIVFEGAGGKYRDTLTTGVATPYTGGTAVGAND